MMPWIKKNNKTDYCLFYNGFWLRLSNKILITIELDLMNEQQSWNKD